MGLGSTILYFIESNIEEVFGKVDGLKMLELGDQEIRQPKSNQIYYFKDWKGIDGETSGKEYFTKRGYHHTSVDEKGLRGAEVRDLTKPEQFLDWHDCFDVITNSGTTEHVEPHEAQYDCFKILHDCLKVGGIFIHSVPSVYAHDVLGIWKGHCKNYYHSQFFEMLAEENDYELLRNTEMNNNCCVVLRKVIDKPFMHDRDALNSLVARRIT